MEETPSSWRLLVLLLSQLSAAWPQHLDAVPTTEPPSIVHLPDNGPRMTLPPELVDEILTHLRRDSQALRNCSLVAKTWTYPSQKYLYTYLHVTPSNYQTWREIASPTSAELLRHVHSLTCCHYHILRDFQEDYLRSFHYLQNLTLMRVFNIGLDTVDSFSAFQNTLSSLFLSNVTFTLDAFVKLLGYFPNLRRLNLDEPFFYAEHRTVPSPSTPPRGTLCFSLTSVENTDILLRGLCELELEYDRLEIINVGRGLSASRLRSIISACEKTLKYLTLRPCTLHALHNNITSTA